MGFLAWRLYEADGAEHSLLRAIVAAILTAIAIFALDRAVARPIVPEPRRSPASCATAAARSRRPPRSAIRSRAWSSSPAPATRLTDTAGAAEFLRGGECRFAFIEARHERSFAQRAEAIGLRYTAGPRIEAINISTGQPITIAVYRSVGAS